MLGGLPFHRRGEKASHPGVRAEIRYILFHSGSQYRAIGRWWDSKGYTDTKGNHQQCEIDIVAVSADDKSVELIEVKRNPEKYNAALMKEKVAFFSRKEKRLSRYRKVIRCLSLEDM